MTDEERSLKLKEEALRLERIRISKMFPKTLAFLHESEKHDRVGQRKLDEKRYEMWKLSVREPEENTEFLKLIERWKTVGGA